MSSRRIEAAEAGFRIDVFLSENDPSHSRSYYKNRIAEGEVKVNGETVKAGYLLREGDVIEAELKEPVPLEIAPEEIPLKILYEDSDVILVDKPKGMVVHPAAGHYTGTLVNALLLHCRDLSGINGVLRPGIVHRIDRDTSGVVIACKNDEAHNAIAAQLKEHSITRRYIALVTGNLKEDEGTVDAPIGRHRTERKKMAVDPEHGKRAVTHYRVLERFGSYTLLECRLETGRTHQIRVHMAHIRHPLVGDTVYSSQKCRFETEGQCLHAYVLGFVHPRTGEYMEFSSELPDYFKNLLDKLRKDCK